MTGKPQRTYAKVPMQALISAESYRAVQPLLAVENSDFASFSSLFETIVFLSEHMYIEEPENGFVTLLVNLKTELTLERLKSSSMGASRRIHVTIDKSACDFIDMLRKRYGFCFSSRSEVSDLLLFNIGRNCNTPEGINYYRNRLAEVLYLHPTRSGQI